MIQMDEDFEPADCGRALPAYIKKIVVLLLPFHFFSFQVTMAIKTQTPQDIQYQGKQAPVCALETVDFSRLLSQEPAEVEKLLRCCQTHGFFYLDLQGIDGRRMLDDEQQLLQVMRGFFNQPAETKLAFCDPAQAHGLEAPKSLLIHEITLPSFEPVGNHAGVMENSKDGYEILYVSFSFGLELNRSVCEFRG